MHTSNIDTPEVVLHYLKETGRIPTEEQPVVTILEGGVSNRTYLIQRESGQDWVLKQAREKLKVQVDWYCSPERIQREALGMIWLAQLAPAGAIPELIFEDRENHLLAMAAVPQPHENWKSVLLRGDVRPSHIEQFGRLLGAIHRGSVERKSEIFPIFEDRKYFIDLRLEPYYGYTADQVPESSEFIQILIQDTLSHRLCLVHGDYSPKNVLIYQDRLILLDHEVAHWGDPAFDIGFSLTHFLSKAHHLPAHRPLFLAASEQYWQNYQLALEGWSPDPDFEPRSVRHTLGCLLARVAGRSPLEYLSPEEKERQKQTVLRLMSFPPERIPELLLQFSERLA